MGVRGCSPVGTVFVGALTVGVVAGKGIPSVLAGKGAPGVVGGKGASGEVLGVDAIIFLKKSLFT